MSLTTLLCQGQMTHTSPAPGIPTCCNRNCTLHLCNSFQWWSLPAKKHWSSLISCIVCVVLKKLKFILNDLKNGQTIILFSSGVQVRCELVMWHLSKGMFQPFMLLKSLGILAFKEIGKLWDTLALQVHIVRQELVIWPHMDKLMCGLSVNWWVALVRLLSLREFLRFLTIFKQNVPGRNVS